MRLALRLIAALALLPVAGQAWACGGDAPYFLVLIHDALPNPLPAGAIVVEVEFETANRRAYFAGGVRARIRRMIQGDYRGDTLIARSRDENSCYFPFAHGAAGLIVARPLGLEAGELVVEPIPVQGREGYRLADGFQIGAR